MLVCVGRIAAEKNLTLAVEAYRAMRRLNDRIKLVIVGDGPLRSVLQGKYSELIFAGMQTGEQLARYYASGDIFLFPSETESFGKVTHSNWRKIHNLSIAGSAFRNNFGLRRLALPKAERIRRCRTLRG